MVGVRYTICHWATNRTDPQNLLSTTLDVPLQQCPYHKWSLTICDGCFDTLRVQKCEVRQVTKDVVKSEV